MQTGKIIIMLVIAEFPQLEGAFSQLKIGKENMFLVLL